MMMLKKNNAYLALVPLIKRITKIESALNTLEGEGDSMQAKVLSIKELNSTDFILRVNKIIGLRNNALHGDLDEVKITQALDECDTVLQIIEYHMQLHAIENKIELKLKKFKHFYKESKIKLIEPIALTEDNIIAYLERVVQNEKNRLLELNQYIKAYWKEERFIPFFKGTALFVVALYILSKLYR